MSAQQSKTTTPSVIHARGLTRRYGDTAVVDGIDLDIIRGEVFGSLRPHGAGKTTTLLMMLGLAEISSGATSVLGVNPISDMPYRIRRCTGFKPSRTSGSARPMITLIA